MGKITPIRPIAIWHSKILRHNRIEKRLNKDGLENPQRGLTDPGPPEWISQT